MASGNPVNSVLPSRQENSSYPGFGFAAMFIIAAGISAALMSFLNTAITAFARLVTIPSTMLLGNAMGLSMTSNGNIITVNGFAMEIINQCTAFNYITILALAILLYTHHTLKYRLAGIIISSLILLIVNAVRLIVTGMVGTITTASVSSKKQCSKSSNFAKYSFFLVSLCIALFIITGFKPEVILVMPPLIFFVQQIKVYAVRSEAEPPHKLYFVK